MNTGHELEDGRAAKRPRTIGIPDGFSKPKSKAKPPPTSLPKIQDFTSAFGDISRAGPSKPLSRSGDVVARPSKQLKAPVMENPFGSDVAAASFPKPQISRKTAKRNLATTTLQAQTSAQPSLSGGPMRFKPPSVKTLDQKDHEDVTNKSHAQSSSKQQRNWTADYSTFSKRKKPEASGGTVINPPLRKLTIPPSIIVEPSEINSASKKSVPLRALVPPPLPIPKTPPLTTSKPLRTINTTRMALATDPTSSDGPAELLSLFLQAHKDDIPTRGNGGKDIEQHRGVNLSPEKKGKTGRKFIRGGLAEQASRLFSQAHMAISLWQREIEMKYRLSPKAMSSDLRLKISRIVHMPTPNSSSYYGLAECRQPDDEDSSTLACSPPEFPSGTPFFAKSSSKRTRDKTPDLVLFSFVPPPIAYSADIGIRTATRFAVGREVLLWRPWQEVEVTFPATSSVSMHADAQDGKPAIRTVIFCTRFMISS